jgi:hypothetical protein
VSFVFACTWGLVLEVLPCVEGLYHVISAKCEIIAANFCGAELLACTTVVFVCVVVVQISAAVSN